VGAGNAVASPRKFFGQNLGKSGQNSSKIWTNFGKIWEKVIKIWANLIRFEQNQNLASRKTLNFLWLCRVLKPR